MGKRTLFSVVVALGIILLLSSQVLALTLRDPEIKDLSGEITVRDYEGKEEFSLEFVYLNDRSMNYIWGPESVKIVRKLIRERNCLLLLVFVKQDSYFYPTSITFVQEGLQYEIGYDDMVKMSDTFSGHLRAGVKAFGFIFIPEAIDVYSSMKIYYYDDYTTFSVPKEKKEELAIEEQIKKLEREKTELEEKISESKNGQHIKIQTGTTLSKLDWQNLGLYNETLIGHSLLAGIDYLENKYFNLSSNLGFIQKGGKETLIFVDVEGEQIAEITMEAKLDYFTVNTTLDLKYPIKDKILSFISVGPRFDYLVSYSYPFDGLNDAGVLKKYNFGLILGGGIKYDLSEIQIGLRADYYLDFDKVADWPAETGNSGGKVEDKTITLNLTIGYKL
jgi:hypothetical protein